MTIVPSTRIGEILDASITDNVIEYVFAACAVVAARLELDAPAQAATLSCTFTKIAATGGEFSFLRRDAAINDSGEVAFTAFLSAGGFSTSRRSGGALTTIADTSGEFSSLSSPSINNGGDVAFKAILDADGQSINRGNGAAIMIIADLNDGFSNIADDTSINDAGNVAFGATPDAGGASINVGAGGAITTTADTNGVLFSSLSLRSSISAVAGRATLVPRRDRGPWNRGTRTARAKSV